MKTGNIAPDFILKDRFDKDYKLSAIKNKKVVYFYPKDSTPGCTIEAKEFSSNLENFQELNTTVIGISGGDNKTKEKFCNSYNLKHILLSDTNFEVSKKYNVYGEKSFLGKKYMGIDRTTFVLDENNKILHVFNKVKALGHAKEVLDYLKNIK